jgi:hypothetical protein
MRNSLGKPRGLSLLFLSTLTKIFIFWVNGDIISKDLMRGSGVMFSYEGLNERLRVKAINKSDFTEILGISSRTIANRNHLFCSQVTALAAP